MSMKQTMCEFVHGMTCKEVAVFLGSIVRCRDCKWFSRAMLNCARFRHGDGVYSKVEPDGFCAWGESLRLVRKKDK